MAELRFQSFHASWLAGQGLTAIGATGDMDLAPEGRAVLLMLLATRPARFGPLPIGHDAVLKPPSPDDDRSRREAWFGEVARFADQLPCRFVRDRIGTSHVILLKGEGYGHRMPMRRVLWAQAFADEETRDQLFFWLAVRLDRWRDWGEQAWKGGAAAFTQHLLQLVATALPGWAQHPAVMLLEAPQPERD